MVILGLNCTFWHDPAAALVIDGKVVAAAEEERFSRRKHAFDELPVAAAKYCLSAAGLHPQDVDAVAYSWSEQEITANRWSYFKRNWRRAPRRTFRTLRRFRKRTRYCKGRLSETLRRLDFPTVTRVIPVEHHIAHAASAFYSSGFEKAAILSIDGTGEVATTLFGEGHALQIDKLAEIQKPDSLGLFYSSMTEYLGFEMNDGEYKLMGMAAYGDPAHCPLDDLLEIHNGDLRLDTRFTAVRKTRRWQGRSFSAALVNRLGPPREGDTADPPYTHVAAATQDLFERRALALVDHHLPRSLTRHRRLCFAGGCALNVVLNRKLIAHPFVDELFVPPSPADAGTALGAALWGTAQSGQECEPLRNPYLGPEFDTQTVTGALDHAGLPFEVLEDPIEFVAELLAAGEVVGWFQGRMEWGPRALGNRSILAHPGKRGIADTINTQIKFREKWRPFCPSILDARAAELLGTTHPSPFMTYSFEITPEWRERIPEVIHVDGTLRPQVVTAELNPRFYALISAFERRTDLPCVINTSLNRRGEPMVCSPADAVATFLGSGLRHLVMGDVYVGKE